MFVKNAERRSSTRKRVPVQRACPIQRSAVHSRWRKSRARSPSPRRSELSVAARTAQCRLLLRSAQTLWHGYVPENKLPNNYFLHGTNNLPVACSTVVNLCTCWQTTRISVFNFRTKYLSWRRSYWAASRHQRYRMYDSYRNCKVGCSIMSSLGI